MKLPSSFKSCNNKTNKKVKQKILKLRCIDPALSECCSSLYYIYVNDEFYIVADTEALTIYIYNKGIIEPFFVPDSVTDYHDQLEIFMNYITIIDLTYRNICQ